MARLIVFCWMVLLVPKQAHAYLDPSAGGLLAQVLLGGFAGVAVLVRMYWNKLTGRSPETAAEDNNSADGARESEREPGD